MSKLKAFADIIVMLLKNQNFVFDRMKYMFSFFFFSVVMLYLGMCAIWII